MIYIEDLKLFDNGRLPWVDRSAFAMHNAMTLPGQALLSK